MRNLLLFVLALLALPVAADGATKPVISSASEFPTVIIQLPVKPSLLVTDGGPDIVRIQREVEDYVEMMFRDYDIPDVGTRRQLVAIQLQVAFAEKRWDDVIRLVNQLRALEDKPSSKAMDGIITSSYARAAKAVGVDSPQFGDRFQQEFTTAVAKLDWSVTQDELQSLRGEYQVMTRDLIIGSLDQLDSVAAAQNNKVLPEFAAFIITARQTMTLLPLNERIFTVIDKRVKSESTEKVDRWTPRQVTLRPSQVVAPVVIGLWDTGTDPAVLAGRLWTNVKEKQNGKDDDGNGFVDDVHGIAFDPDFKHTTGMLRPVETADLAGLQGQLKLTKGSLDLDASIESPEAAEFRRTVASLKSDQVMPFMLALGKVSVYLHGTTTAYTSALGNPGARVLTVRYDQRISEDPEPLDEKAALAMAANIRDAVAYFKSHGVRVVNMSWRITEPQIDGSLLRLEPDPAKRNIRTQAVFKTINSALEEAFSSAPEILFIAGAGNEDEDVDFVRSFPAGINLPNVMTVGAVDVALRPARFTSYGKSIDIYANGFEVPTKVPGGMSLNVSGTSIAAPQVTNLAAKLFAVNPRLTAARVRAIIEGTATSEGDKGLKVINPKAALAQAK
jgi:hypothetical protein